MISSLSFIARRWLRAPFVSSSKADHAFVSAVRERVTRLPRLSDADLTQETARVRKLVESGNRISGERVVVPVFAVAVEAARRVLAVELYDSQLLGGLALARGKVAEMQTGEGKTLAALLPACLHALTGSGVHVMTVNAYLARRDYDLLAPVFRLLGLSVGLVESAAGPAQKRDAYACDVTYGPGYEFGFDYLRDQVALLSCRKPLLGESFRHRLHGKPRERPTLMHRGHAVAIVDEADSVMIDEATTPLVLSAASTDPAPNSEVYLAALRMAAQLEIDVHFIVDEEVGTLQLTELGTEQLQSHATKIPRCGLDRPWSVYIEQALRAELHVRRDVHYVVRDDEVRLVDEFTGRIFADRSWSEGLHQAVQAKEGVTVTKETKSIARITRQRFFRLYEHLCGMTGTARGSERELRDVYGLDVVVIRPHKQCQRRSLPTRVFPNRGSKERAIVDSVVQVHRTGQPVLVGTASIETSERIVELLDEVGVGYQLLNGKQDAEEAAIMAGAGQPGAVTIATNMAGRGTDIKLRSGAAQLGGLHVIATEPQQSTRVDRQLVGRAARQGDPGSCQLFVSADDQLIERHAPSLARRIKRECVENGISKATRAARRISRLQCKVERARANHRRRMYSHDDWLEEVLRVLTPSSGPS